MRLGILIAAALVAGCGGDPPFDPDGPAASRLAPGAGAIVKSSGEGDTRPAASLIDHEGGIMVPSVTLADGTRLRVVSDERPARVEFRTAPDVDRTRVDRRPVSVYVLDGPREGEAGAIFRDDLRPDR